MLAQVLNMVADLWSEEGEITTYQLEAALARHRLVVTSTDGEAAPVADPQAKAEADIETAVRNMRDYFVNALKDAGELMRPVVGDFNGRAIDGPRMAIAVDDIDDILDEASRE